MDNNDDLPSAIGLDAAVINLLLRNTQDSGLHRLPLAMTDNSILRLC